MDWNGNLRGFAPRPAAAHDASFSFLYNNYNFDQFPGMEMKHGMPAAVPAMEKGNMLYNNLQQLEKKKRLTSDQLESLENSFQEEIKLDPDRKMKLAKELGLQPRQIAVWFQNRRARWKAKQLERLYDSLKQQFDAVSREKHKLQEEVWALRAILKEQVGRKQISTNCTEISASGEETVESTSIPSSSDKARQPTTQVGDCSYVFNVDDYNPAMTPVAYWAAQLPSAAYP